MVVVARGCVCVVCMCAHALLIPFRFSLKHCYCYKNENIKRSVTVEYELVNNILQGKKTKCVFPFLLHLARLILVLEVVELLSSKLDFHGLKVSWKYL